MELTDVVKNLWVGSTGNRLTLAGYLLCANKFAASTLIPSTDYSDISSILGNIGVVLVGVTFFGLSTLVLYTRTKKHIRKFGKLNPRFVKIIVEHGHCTSQGAYLAAKEFDQLDAFNETTKKYSNNTLPNF